jgi:hypothetical protein
MFCLLSGGAAQANTGKGERGGGDYLQEIPLIFNWFRKIKKDCGQKFRD